MRVLSVIIPVLNDDEALAQCLEALARQTYTTSHVEILVVDNGSDTPPVNVTEAYDNVRLIYESKEGSYAARNRGLEEAAGELLAFTDADCIPHPDWLEEGVRCFQGTDRCGLVGGKIEITAFDPEQPTPCERYDKLKYLDQQRAVTRGHYAATANLFTSKEVMRSVGRFNENLLSGGDNEWGQRVHRCGYRLVYCEKAKVRHPARSSFKQLLKKEIRLGGGLAQIEKMHASDSGAANARSWSSYLQPFLQTTRSALGVIVGSTSKHIPSIVDRIYLGWIIFILENVRRIERWRVKSGGKPFNL